MNLYSFSVAVFSYGVFLVTVLAFINKKDNVGYRFLAFGLSIIGWGFVFCFWINQRYTAELTLMLVRISYIFCLFIPVTWIHFVFEFLNKKEPFKGFLLINYSLTFLLLLIIPTPLLFEGTHSLLEFKYLPDPGPLHIFHIIQFCVLVPYGLWLLWVKLSATSGFERDQLNCLFWGTFFGFTSGGTIYLSFYAIPFPMYLTPFMTFYPLFLGIGLIRYGLFNPNQIADAIQNEKLAAIGLLSASINHEIKNPLYIIQGLASSFVSNHDEKKFSDEKNALSFAKDTMAKIETQAARASTIMKRFSSFLKKRTSVNAYDEVLASNLLSVLEDALLLIKYEMELDKIDLKIDIPSDLPQLKISPNALEEIIFNLMMNSCQAMRQSGGLIRVAAKHNNGKIFIEISDTGPGIPERFAKKIFDPFYSTKKNGTGLGLFITKQILIRNGGSVEFESQEGQGTKVRFSIPDYS